MVAFEPHPVGMKHEILYSEIYIIPYIVKSTNTKCHIHSLSRQNSMNMFSGMELVQIKIGKFCQ
jgi:hypothetical protein